MSDRAEADSPFVVARGTVVEAARLTPSFVRITLGGGDLRAFGNPRRVLDQRIKLIIPGENGRLPAPDSLGSDWYSDWLALPEAERGSMRTYSIRDLQVDEGGETRVVIDFVLHLEPGASGPASRWAARAAAGDQLLLVGPRRGCLDGGGIEYRPGEASPVFLVGDETAAPAIARILEESAAAGGPRGGDGNRRRAITAFVEVPHGTDMLDIRLGPGQDVRWLARGDRASGTAVIPAVMGHLGHGVGRLDTDMGVPDTTDGSAPWETPDYSNLPRLATGASHAGPTSESAYFWIAGESGLVTALRRYLVRDLGIDRSRVAFMGYWRRGVAMRG